jgi:type IV secretory pathway VirD2 relaxase
MRLVLAARLPRFIIEVQAIDAEAFRFRLSPMSANDDQFEIRPGRPGSDRAPKLRSIRAAIRAATWATTGARPRIAPRTGLRAHFRKSAGASPKAVSLTQRRVVVKVRYVSHGGGKGAPLSAHVRYLAREMAARERTPDEIAREQKASELGRSVDYLGREQLNADAKAPFYDNSRVGIDARAQTSAWTDDTRHFRMIVSAEDGAALGDLKPFIRELVASLESKLGTRLEWLAVDHWDTDNPHSHILLRGRRADGQDLFIPSRLVSQGIRDQAQEIVTRILGPRQAIELERDRFRDIAAKAVTQMDTELLAGAARGNLLQPRRPELIARLQQLEVWGLARKERQGWSLQQGLLGQLDALAQHADVERAVAATRGRAPTEPLLAADPLSPVWGRVVHAAQDDLGENFLAVIETAHGELRYARFDRGDDLAVLSDVTPGALVVFTPATAVVRPSDEVVARISKAANGLYSPQLHAAQEPRVSDGLLAANVRRLEAMRRAGLVTRRADGIFEIGHDHLGRALAYEARQLKRFPVRATVASYWTLNEQVTALGPTHLDGMLAGDAAAAGQGRFAREVETAMQRRRLFLIEQGLMGPQDRAPSRTALAHLADRELQALAESLSREFGLPVATYRSDAVRGVYARRIDLAQGRVALIVGDRDAHLVPWRASLERFSGRKVEGTLRGQGMSWALARAGPNLPPM